MKENEEQLKKDEKLLEELEKLLEKISKEELDKYNSAATNPLGVVLRYTLSLKSVTQIYPDPITQLR